MTDWSKVRVHMVPRIPRELRPEYCGAVSEDIEQCPVCPATVSGKDIVHGVCQALRSGPAPKPLVELTTVRK